MPKIDRAYLQNTFHDLVKQSGGVYKAFDQEEWIKSRKVNKLPDSYHGGACSALTTVFLSRYKRNTKADNVWAPFTFTDLVQHHGSTFLIQQLQQSERSRTFFFRAVDKNNEDETKDVLAAVGFGKRLKDHMLALGQAVHVHEEGQHYGSPPFHDMVNEIAGHDGRHYLHLPRHAVGAITDRAGKKYKFFDPNFGQAIFTEESAYRKFLSGFFSSILKTLYQITHVVHASVSL